MSESDDHRAQSFYDEHAERLSAQYDAMSFETVHEAVLDLLPEPGALVLDVGAGSGRDAAWFAARGDEVVAVEPARRLKAVAEARHRDAGVRWLDDRLPALAAVYRSQATFDLVWLSAVWMHVAPSERPRAFAKLVGLLRPGGRIMLSLRLGEIDDGRRMHPVSAEEIESLAQKHGLAVLWRSASDDRLGRSGIRWETLCLQAPDSR